MEVNAQYNVASPDSLSIRIAGVQRRRMFEAFLRSSGIGGEETVLDVGVTSDQSYDHSNYLEAWYPRKASITALGLHDAAFLEKLYPGVRFIRGDGRSLPFANASFDYVHSSAVLEHVGSRAQQTDFLRELWRVCRRGIFVTTPNRWFPVEFHTVLPLVHWLPPRMFRRLLGLMGHDFFADEANLNLLSRSELVQAASNAGITRHRVDTVSLFGWATNILLFARR